MGIIQLPFRRHHNHFIQLHQENANYGKWCIQQLWVIQNNIASQDVSTAMGEGTEAIGNWSTALGNRSKAIGRFYSNFTSGWGSTATAMGDIQLQVVIGQLLWVEEQKQVVN